MSNHEPQEYLAYRFLVIHSGQLSYLPNKPKEEIMKKAMLRLSDKKKLSISIWSRKYLLFFVNKLRDGLYVCKFAREKHFTKLTEGSDDLVPTLDVDYYQATVIIELRKQVILIQKTSAWKPEAIVSQVQIALERLGDFGPYKLIISEISNQATFWNQIEKAERVYELDITLHGPNFFHGLYKADRVVTELQDIYGSAESSFRLKNRKGALNLVKEQLADFISYVSAGGGHYKLKLKLAGKRMIETVNSVRNTLVVSLSGDKTISENNEIEAVIDYVHHHGQNS